MNKQEIVALINAAIAGQGSQVDISGKLPAILSSIVDLIPEGGNAPLVVSGEFDTAGHSFTPAAGQPSHMDAEVAYRQGRPILLENATGEFSAMVMGIKNGEDFLAFVMDTDLTYIIWSY